MPPVRRVEGLWESPVRVFGSRLAVGWGVVDRRDSAPSGHGLVSAAEHTRGSAHRGRIQRRTGVDDYSAAVVGMTVAADRDPTVTTAYLISMEHVLGLDPDLLPSPTVAWSRSGRACGVLLRPHRRTPQTARGPARLTSRRGRRALRGWQVVPGEGWPAAEACGRKEPVSPISIRAWASRPSSSWCVPSSPWPTPGSTRGSRTDDAERLAQAPDRRPRQTHRSARRTQPRHRGAGAARLVLFVDQFEEYAAGRLRPRVNCSIYWAGWSGR